MADIQAYSTTSIDVTFSPTKVGQFDGKLVLQFSGGATPDHVVAISGTGSDVPIFVEREVLDFRVCYFGTLYREVLVLRNRGSSALKFQIDAPKELKGFIEFTPTYGFVQVQSSFQVQMKFRPDLSILQQCGKCADLGNNIITVPIRVQVPDQTLPVFFTITAQLTYSDLLIEPSHIEFGECSVHESVSVPIKITSKSILPQQYGFVNLSKEVEVQPGDGFGTILPLESITRNVIFSPRSATLHTLNLTLKTLAMREYQIPCRGVGVVAPLKISASSIYFAATAFGDSNTEHIFVTNISALPQTFEFAIPADSFLQIAPVVGTIAPQKTIHIQFHFSPPPLPSPKKPSKDEVLAPSPIPTPDVAASATRDSSKKQTPVSSKGKPQSAKEKEKEKKGKDAKKMTPTGKKKGGKDEDESTFAEDEEGDGAIEVTVTHAPVVDDVLPIFKEPIPESIHNSWKIPCFVQGKEGHVLYMDVRTTIVKPIVTISNPEYQSGINFKQVPIGQKVIKILTLKNNGDAPIPLSLNSIDPFGAFLVLNAVYSRTIKAKESKDLIISFNPEKDAEYFENMTLICGPSKLTVPLRGRGIRPTLRIEPPEPVFDLGDVLVGDVITKVFTIISTSIFDLRYKVEMHTKAGSANYNNICAFDCVPIEANLVPGGQQKVVVSFHPDHESAKYASEAHIVVSQEQEEQYIVRLEGRGWAAPLYLMGYDEQVEIEDLYMLPSEFNRKGSKTVEVTLRWMGGGPVLRELEIGCVKPGGDKKIPSGEFSIDALSPQAMKDGFSISTNKGNVEPGSRKKVEIRFLPNFQSDAGITGSIKGQWLEATVQCLLKGAPTGPDKESGERRYTVLLRGYVGASVEVEREERSRGRPGSLGGVLNSNGPQDGMSTPGSKGKEAGSGKASAKKK